VAVPETADRCQRSRAGKQKLDALLRRRGRREQAESLCEPVRRTCRREPNGFLAGLAQESRGIGVALAGRSLDVVSAGRSCRPPGRECLGAPLVGTETPAAGGRLVDSATNERMSKAEASGYVRCTHEVDFEQLVDCIHHR
jgi:hypothetical protein